MKFWRKIVRIFTRKRLPDDIVFSYSPTVFSGTISKSQLPELREVLHDILDRSSMVINDHGNLEERMDTFMDSEWSYVSSVGLYYGIGVKHKSGFMFAVNKDIDSRAKVNFSIVNSHLYPYYKEGIDDSYARFLQNGIKLDKSKNSLIKNL